MRDFQRKRKIKKTLYSKGVLLILLLLLVLVGRATFGIYIKEQGSKQSLDLAKNELAALQAREGKLKEDITRLNTPEGIEAQIREQFQVAKPGERMIVLVDERKTAPTQETKKPSLVSRFLNLFR